MEIHNGDGISNCLITLVYIGCGAGFGGDRPMASLKLLQRVKALNYLVLECLAEHTLTDRYQAMVYGGNGYDSRISEWRHVLLPLAVERGTYIITNIGASEDGSIYSFEMVSHSIILHNDTRSLHAFCHHNSSYLDLNHSIEHREFDIKYKPRAAIKGQVVADFVVEFAKPDLAGGKWPIKEVLRSYLSSNQVGNYSWMVHPIKRELEKE
ncbi:hypothetical protein UlMin_044572 [Ulmus minor]